MDAKTVIGLGLLVIALLFGGKEFLTKMQEGPPIVINQTFDSVVTKPESRRPATSDTSDRQVTERKDESDTKSKMTESELNELNELVTKWRRESDGNAEQQDTHHCDVPGAVYVNELGRCVAGLKDEHACDLAGTVYVQELGRCVAPLVGDQR